MPDFKRRRVSVDTEISDQDRRVQAALELPVGIKEAHRAVVGCTARGVGATPPDDPLSSEKKYNVVKALDNALTQSGHGGLMTWRRADRYCGLLGPTGYRYTIHVPA